LILTAYNPAVISIDEPEFWRPSRVIVKVEEDAIIATELIAVYPLGFPPTSVSSLLTTAPPVAEILTSLVPVPDVVLKRIWPWTTYVPAGTLVILVITLELVVEESKV